VGGSAPPRLAAATQHRSVGANARHRRAGGEAPTVPNPNHPYWKSTVKV
jgi:hypothetical protein